MAQPFLKPASSGGEVAAIKPASYGDCNQGTEPPRHRRRARLRLEPFNPGRKGRPLAQGRERSRPRRGHLWTLTTLLKFLPPIGKRACNRWVRNARSETRRWAR